jgi:hypothetical protein
MKIGVALLFRGTSPAFDVNTPPTFQTAQPGEGGQHGGGGVSAVDGLDGDVLETTSPYFSND